MRSSRHIIIGRLVALSMASIVPLAAGSAAAWAQNVCKTKTAGYFKLFQQDTRTVAAIGGIARPLTNTPGDPARGEAIATNPAKGNCLACHRIPGLSSEAADGTVGPSLDGIGARRSEAELRQIMVDAAPYFPRTVMPGYFKTSGLTRVAAGLAGKTILTADEIEDMVAFLKNLK
jgi:sulfur-oxidizing protein SoxX